MKTAKTIMFVMFYSLTNIFVVRKSRNLSYGNNVAGQHSTCYSKTLLIAHIRSSNIQEKSIQEVFHVYLNKFENAVIYFSLYLVTNDFHGLVGSPGIRSHQKTVLNFYFLV